MWLGESSYQMGVDLKMIDYRSKEEKAWDKKYTMLHLENEIYYFKEDMTTFIIVTSDELKEIKQKTAERMKELGKEKWTPEDFKKLEV